MTAIGVSTTLAEALRASACPLGQFDAVDPEEGAPDGSPEATGNDVDRNDSVGDGSAATRLDAARSSILIDGFEIGTGQRRHDPCRLMKIAVKDGVLYLQSHEVLSGEVPEDVFAGVPDMVSDTEPCFILVRSDRCYNTPHWALICWMPEGVTAQPRLLYSRARSTIDDLISNAGAAQYTQALVCSDKSQLCYRSYLSAMEVFPVAAPPRTRPERLIFSEALAIKSEFGGRTTGPSSNVPLYPTSTCKRLIRSFSTLREHCIMLSLDPKTANLAAEPMPQTSLSTISTRIYAREPRYYLVRHGAGTSSRNTSSIFFLSSPDGSSKYLRVVYASSKGAVLALLEGEGIEIRKSFDVRNATTDLSDLAVSSIPDRRPAASFNNRNNLFSSANDLLSAAMTVKPRPPITRPLGDVFAKLRAAGGVDAPAHADRLVA